MEQQLYLVVHHVLTSVALVHADHSDLDHHCEFRHQPASAAWSPIHQLHSSMGNSR